MSKATKTIRRAVVKQTRKDFISMVQVAWAMPFRLRLSIAWMILKGKTRG